jgi:hypothetical protein
MFSVDLKTVAGAQMIVENAIGTGQAICDLLPSVHLMYLQIHHSTEFYSLNLVVTVLKMHICSSVADIFS